MPCIDTRLIENKINYIIEDLQLILQWYEHQMPQHAVEKMKSTIEWSNMIMELIEREKSYEINRLQTRG